MGLAIFSKFAILGTESKAYTYNGMPLQVWHGDWIVSKGAGVATIDVPGLQGGLDVWVTHVSRVVPALRHLALMLIDLTAYRQSRLAAKTGPSRHAALASHRRTNWLAGHEQVRDKGVMCWR